MSVAVEETIDGTTLSGTSIVLPSWSVVAGEIVLVSVAKRDEGIDPTVAGNGLTFVQILDLDNTEGQNGINLFRAEVPGNDTGSITITLPLNTDPVGAAAARLSGQIQGNNGADGVDVLASDPGPSPDDDDMQVDITTVADNCVILGWGTHRNSSFTPPAGQTNLEEPQVGSSGDTTHSTLWRLDGLKTPAGLETMGQDASLSSVRDWCAYAISIKPLAALPPTVDAGGPYNGDVDTAIALNATVTPGSDPTPVLLWTIFSGPGGGVFSNDAIEDPTFTPDTVGSYVLQLSADPSDGPAVTDTANLESDPVAPTVDAGGPYNGPSGQATALNATVTPGSDPTPVLLWTIDSGGTGSFSNDAIEDPTFTPTFPTVGPYVLRLTVTPSDIGAVFDTANFESDPVAPIVDAGGPYSGTVDLPIALNATVTPGTDPAPTLLWTIDSGPGTGVFLPSATVEDPTFTPDLTGTYTLRLTATSSDTAPVFDTASLDSQGFVPVSAQSVVGIKTDNLGRPVCAFLGIGDPLPIGAIILAGDALAFDGTLLVAIDDGAAPRTVVNGLPHTNNGIRIVIEAPGDVNLNGWRLRSEPLAQCINDGPPPPTPFYNKGFAIDGTGLLFVVDGGPAPTPPPAEFFPPALANLQLWFDVQSNDVNFGPLSTINGVISLDGQNVREMNSRGTGSVAMIQNGGSPPTMRDNGSGPNGTRFLEHIGKVPLLSNPDPSFTGGLTGYAFYVVCRANTIPLTAPNRDAYKWVPTLLWGNNTGNAWQVGFGSTVRVTLKSIVLNQWVYLYGTIDNATDNYVARASGVAQISGNYNTYNNPFSGADVQLGESSIDVVEAASYDRELTLLELAALETYFNDKFGL